MRNNERGAWGFVGWLAVVLSAALVVMAFFMLATSVKAEEASSTCYFLDMEQISDETVEDTRDALVEQGWYADSLDGREALYSPSCLAPGSGV
jgi:hypothetical protein